MRFTIEKYNSDLECESCRKNYIKGAPPKKPKPKGGTRGGGNGGTRGGGNGGTRGSGNRS